MAIHLSRQDTHDVMDFISLAPAAFCRTERQTKMKPNMLIAIAAILALTACGSSEKPAEDARSKVAAAIDEKGLAEALGSAIDQDAVKSVAREAAKQAVRDALPQDELGVAAAIIDEEALVNGIDRAVDGKALKGALEDGVKGATEAAAKR
jgi:hypothetical protein